MGKEQGTDLPQLGITRSKQEAPGLLPEGFLPISFSFASSHRTCCVGSEGWIGNSLLWVGTEGEGVRQRKAPAERSLRGSHRSLRWVRIAILATSLAFILTFISRAPLRPGEFLLGSNRRKCPARRQKRFQTQCRMIVAPQKEEICRKIRTTAPFRVCFCAGATPDWPRNPRGPKTSVRPPDGNAGS